MEQQAIPAAADYAAEQLKLLKRMHAMSLIRTTACVLMLVVLLISALYVLPGVSQLVSKLTLVADNLEQVDITYMTESVTNLAVTGTEGIETALVEVTHALDTINRLDIDSLNKSIQDLGAVVEPLASFFGRR